MALVLDVQIINLSYLVRWLHVAAMAGLFGGAILVWALALRSTTPGGSERDGALMVVAPTYEWVFWGTIGLLVMTGVGNLGAFGAAVPEPDTGWGGRLIVKLTAVGVFVLLSLVRTLLVVLLGVAPDRATPGHVRMLRWAYASSLLAAAAIVGVAVSLAHG